MIEASPVCPMKPLQFLGRYEKMPFHHTEITAKNNLRMSGGFFKGFFATFCAALAHRQKVAAGRLSPSGCLMAWNTLFSAGSTMFAGVRYKRYRFHIPLS